MYLWIIVVAMALALAAEVLSLVAIVLTGAGAARHAMLVTKDFSERLQTSIRLTRELSRSLHPEMEKVRSDGREIGKTLAIHYRAMGALWQDASRRADRLRLRVSREGGATVGRLQHDRRVVSRGVVKPIRTAASVALGIRATTWLLRKVA